MTSQAVEGADAMLNHTYPQEVQHLTNSFTALKQAQAKFQEAKNSLDDITPERACAQDSTSKHPCFCIKLTLLHFHSKTASGTTDGIAVRVRQIGGS